MARPARYIMGAFHPTLRAAPGACAGLSMVSHSVRCRFATKFLLPDNDNLRRTMQLFVKITMTSIVNISSLDIFYIPARSAQERMVPSWTLFWLETALEETLLRESVSQRKNCLNRRP